MKNQYKARFVQETNYLSDEAVDKLLASLEDRCYNEKSKYFQKVGGKGIKICDDWRDSDNFREFLESIGFTDDSKLMRIDLTKDFVPNNVKCEKTPVNSIFKRKLIEYRGQTRGISDWNDFFNFERGTLSKMLKIVAKEGDVGATAVMECAEKLYKIRSLDTLRTIRSFGRKDTVYGSPFCEECDILNDPND